MGTDEVQVSLGYTFGISFCLYAETEIDICVCHLCHIWHGEKILHLHLILAQVSENP